MTPLMLPPVLVMLLPVGPAVVHDAPAPAPLGVTTTLPEVAEAGVGVASCRLFATGCPESERSCSVGPFGGTCPTRTMCCTRFGGLGLGITCERIWGLPLTAEHVNCESVVSSPLLGDLPPTCGPGEKLESGGDGAGEWEAVDGTRVDACFPGGIADRWGGKKDLEQALVKQATEVGAPCGWPVASRSGCPTTPGGPLHASTILRHCLTTSIMDGRRWGALSSNWRQSFPKSGPPFVEASWSSSPKTWGL
mmetsp:Transcript_96775/g.279398  ORF Transcript_96775/g.279398 Transcript_96775/m.279398 type:complete len:250 (+) Transcript_96775:337-1086(+)